ncbi:MAG: hypothetical protein H6704_20220 [Myxococcales bacterium]|nr:hypothetical protein [Myxococcales bacterium]
MARNRWDGFSGFDCDLTEERLRRRRPVPRPKPKPAAKPKPPPVVVHTDEALADADADAAASTPAAEPSEPTEPTAAPRRYGLVRLTPTTPPPDGPAED